MTTYPFRNTISFTSSAVTVEQAADIWELCVEAVENQTGLPVEGGGVEEMSEDDVVDGSPLARRLRKENKDD